MALFGQLFGDGSTSSTDALGNYFQNRMNQDLNRIGLGGNVQAQTTTIPSAPQGPAIPNTPAMTQEPTGAVQPPAPVAPPPITPVPTASQILTQPPGQAPAIPQAAPQVPAPGQAQLQPQAPVAPIAPPVPGQAELAQAPAQQLQQPQAPIQPMIAGTPTSDVGQTPTEQAISQQQQQQPPSYLNTPQLHEQNLVNWQDDPRKIQMIANDTRSPEEGGPPAHVKQMANKIILDHYKDTVGKNEASREANRLADNNDTKGIARVMQKNEPEGSYLKAYLYHRLGLGQLAQQEQIKLGEIGRAHV